MPYTDDWTSPEDTGDFFAMVLHMNVESAMDMYQTGIGAHISQREQSSLEALVYQIISRHIQLPLVGCRTHWLDISPLMRHGGPWE